MFFEKKEFEEMIFLFQCVRTLYLDAERVKRRCSPLPVIDYFAAVLAAIAAVWLYNSTPLNQAWELKLILGITTGLLILFITGAIRRNTLLRLEEGKCVFLRQLRNDEGLKRAFNGLLIHSEKFRMMVEKAGIGAISEKRGRHKNRISMDACVEADDAEADQEERIIN